MSTHTRRANSQHTHNHTAIQAHDDAHAAPDHGLERLIFFSDAVFAIAITLLALDIRLPTGREIASEQDLLLALIEIWPRYLAYIVSFFVIGMYWMSHHRMFRSIVRYDRRLLFFNLLLLLCIGFVPFPTAILGEHGNQVATIFYALTMLITGVVNTLLWWYASSAGRLLNEPLSKQQMLITWLRMLIGPTVFLISIGIAFWDDTAAKFSWIALVPLLLIPTATAKQ
jgi:uncharacterized membrane protein